MQCQSNIEILEWEILGVNMKCKLCGCDKVIIEYEGKIRDGRVGRYTNENVKMFKCEKCNTIWHDALKSDLDKFYQSDEYRKSLEGTVDINEFYKSHDSESFDKFKYTGTTCFRDKVVADIGAGGGAFLDYINTVAKDVVAVEPTEVYRNEMVRKGYWTYAYAKDALVDWKDKVDIIVSFDVIEHVENPMLFIQEIYELLSENGRAFIGTPTDAPVMRKMLGNKYEEFLFSTQHPWVLSEKSFQFIAEQCIIANYVCKYYQRYGLGNFIFWLTNRAPGKHYSYDFVTKSMDEVWKSELEAQKYSDYIVFEFEK